MTYGNRSKRLIGLLLLLSGMSILASGCHRRDPDILHPEDFITETTETILLRDEYYKMSEKYRQLFLQLKFDVYIPTDMKVYDSGEESGLVILSDSAGKDFLTLETRQRGDFQIIYNEYLNAVTSGIGDRDSIQIYDDFSIPAEQRTTFQNGEPLNLQAKRFDVKTRELSQKKDNPKAWDTIGRKCISYWFFNVDAIEEAGKTILPRTCITIMTETFIPEGSSDFSNVDIMQKIVNTIDLTRLFRSAGFRELDEQ